MIPDTSGMLPALKNGAVKYLLIACAVAGTVTLYLLATASANTALFSQHYPLLLGLNAVLVAPQFARDAADIR